VQAQNSNESNDSGFRFNLGGGAKYENASGVSGYMSASPQFNLNKKGDNNFWMGPYFNLNLGNKSSDTGTKGPFSETSLVDRESEIQRKVDSSYGINSNINKPYGFGLNLTYEFGKDNKSELEFKAGLTKKNTSTSTTAEKSITYSRNNEILDESTISDTDKSSNSEYISNFELGYNRELFNSVDAGAFVGYSDNLYGGIKLGIPIGDK